MPPRRSPILRSLAVAGLLALLTACNAARSSSPGTGGPATGAPPGTPVTFRSSDGLTLAGRLFGSGTTGVVLAHMFPDDATSWYPLADRLGRAGYLALAFNFRGYDGSEGRRDIPKAPIDVKAAYQLLRSRGASSVALVGASMGGTATLIAASDPATPPAAVVALSAPVNFQGLDAEEAAPGVHAPVLFMAAQEDAAAVQGLRRLSEIIPGSVETKVYGGNAHGTVLLADRPESAEEILTFLRARAPVTP